MICFLANDKPIRAVQIVNPKIIKILIYELAWINRKISIKATLVSIIKKKKVRIVALHVLSFYIGRGWRKRFDYINMTKSCSLPKKLRLLYNDNLITLKLLTRV